VPDIRVLQEVCPQDFGAIADDAHDDTEAIMAASAWCKRTGASLVWPEGDYRCRDKTNPPCFVTIQVRAKRGLTSQQNCLIYDQVLRDIGALERDDYVEVVG
jgi:hypothetical protein